MNKQEYNDYERKFNAYLADVGIDAEVFAFETSCHTVEDAVKTVGADPSEFVKNICLIGDDGSLIVAIIPGNRRLSRGKVGRALNIAMPELATQRQVEEYTGYLVGGVPPCGYKARFVIDELVMQNDSVYASAGSPYSLMKVNPHVIQNVNDGLVGRISKR